MNMNEISLRDLGEVWFGNAQDDLGKTGVTVAIFPKGARCLMRLVFSGGSI